MTILVEVMPSGIISFKICYDLLQPVCRMFVVIIMYVLNQRCDWLDWKVETNFLGADRSQSAAVAAYKSSQSSQNRTAQFGHKFPVVCKEKPTWLECSVMSSFYHLYGLDHLS